MRLREAFFLAATLGAEADRRLRRFSALDLPRAAVWQAGCAAYLEEYIDGMEEDMRREAPGLYLRPRFSPGYGDLDISHQRAMFDLLELEKRLGLSLTQTQMMLPEKSVTAIAGLSNRARRACGRLRCLRKDRLPQQEEGHMKNFRDRLGRELLLMDGAMGTMLQSRGLKLGELPGNMNLRAPEVVRGIHAEYAAAGADIIQANTFGVSRLKFGDETAQSGARGHPHRPQSRGRERARGLCGRRHRPPGAAAQARGRSGI